MGGLEAAGRAKGIILFVKAAITGAFGLVDAVTLYAGTQPTWTFIRETVTSTSTCRSQPQAKFAKAKSAAS